MGLIQDGDVTSLLRDEALMNQVAAGLVEDTDTMDTLADDC